MRVFVWSVVGCVFAAPAAAQERFVERTPLPRHPTPHTFERAGNPDGVRPHAVPLVTANDVGGYVGGRRLLGNNPWGRGAGAATGPVRDGTYGTDYAGFHVRSGRVFLAASPDPSAGPPVARGYRTDGRYPPDVFGLRPFRKAVVEKHELVEGRKPGGE